MRRWFDLVKQAASDFADDNAISQAAALSFYAALSFAPLLLILLWVASLLGTETQDAMIEQFQSLMGPQVGEAMTAVLDNAETTQSLGSLSAVVGVVTLLFSATGVFAQLQGALNHIWEVRPEPGRGLRHFIRTRMLSLGMLAACGFLLLVSLAVSTAIALVLPNNSLVTQAGSFVGSIGVFTAAFAGIYIVLPDSVVRARDALVGGLITAVLFAIGKEAIGIYLGRGTVGSSYGAAGSLLVFLVWVYYTAIIVLFGAELTQAYAARFGDGIEPSKHAIAADRENQKRAEATAEEQAEHSDRDS